MSLKVASRHEQYRYTTVLIVNMALSCTIAEIQQDRPIVCNSQSFHDTPHVFHVPIEWILLKIE